MPNKHIKKHSTSLLTRKMWIKTTMKYHYTSIRITQRKINWPYQVLVRMWNNWNSHTLLERLQNSKTLENHFWQFFIKSSILLTIHPAIQLIGTYHPNELKSYVHTKIWTQMSLAKITGNNPNVHSYKSIDKFQSIILN